MRPMWLFLVGIAAWGCRDNPTERTRTEPTPVAPVAAQQNAAAAAPARGAPPAPSLEAGAAFDSEARDATWASATEQAIHAVAPQLADVTCRRAQCRVTLTAASEAELVAAVDKLQGEDSLRGIDGVEHIVLTRPAEDGGAHAMQIYVRFERTDN